MEKKHNALLKSAYIISILAAVATIILVFFAPETVPIHYNLNGEADSYGPRWIILFFSVALVINAVYWGKRIKREADEKIEANSYVALAMSILFSGIFIFFAIRVLEMKWILVEMIKQINFYGYLSFMAGITFIIMGFAISKAPYNASIGIKTSWSIKSEKCWENTQKTCKVLFIIIGVLMILQVFWVSGVFCLITLIAEMIIASILSMVISYLICNKEKTV